MKELEAPDPFRMRYQALIKEIVPSIVRGGLNKTQAIATILQYAEKHVSADDKLLFIEAVEKDIMALHEGNIARHRLSLSEYEKWVKGWQ